MPKANIAAIAGALAHAAAKRGRTDGKTAANSTILIEDAPEDALDPELIQLSREVARLMRERKYQQADTLLQARFTACPEEVNCHLLFQAAKIHFIYGLNNAAKQYLDRALDKKEDDIYCLQLYGDISADEEDISDALAFYESAFETMKQRPGKRRLRKQHNPKILLSKIIHLQERSEDFEAALENVKLLISLDPDDAQSWSQRCSLHYQLRQFDRALRAAERGRKIAPADEALLRQQEWCTIQLENAAARREHYEP